MLTVRRYQPEELPAILQRSVETARTQLVARDQTTATPLGVESQMRHMYQIALATPGATILVADWPGGGAVTGPAAYVLLMPQASAFTAEREIIVLDIYTDPRLRGRKVGRTLLQHAEQYARSLGCRAGLVAQVALHNRASLQMLLKAGYAPERLVVGKRL